MKSLLLAASIFLLWDQNGDKLIADDLILTETEDVIRVSAGTQTVLQYLKKSSPVPAGLDKHFSRSGYIHPVFTPKGQVITDDYPQDHAHQHALFFAWTKCKFEGRSVDFWNQAKQLGRIEFRKVLHLRRQERIVEFSVQQAFMVKDADSWKDVLLETWTVTTHKPEDDVFLFDIRSEQTCASNSALKLPRYRYGGMALRASGQWYQEQTSEQQDASKVTFLTSEGKNRETGNHTQANWVALSGEIDNHPATIAVFSSPNNFRSPQPIRLHPSKPYFCFAPMVNASFEITPGQSYTSAYRYLVTSAPIDNVLLQYHWDQYKKAMNQKTTGPPANQDSNPM